jgi:hypothetical protein
MRLGEKLQSSGRVSTKNTGPKPVHYETPTQLSDIIRKTIVPLLHHDRKALLVSPRQTNDQSKYDDHSLASATCFINFLVLDFVEKPSDDISYVIVRGFVSRRIPSQLPLHLTVAHLSNTCVSVWAHMRMRTFTSTCLMVPADHWFG